MKEHFYKVEYDSMGDKGYFYVATKTNSFVAVCMWAVDRVQNGKFAVKGDHVTGVILLKSKPKDRLYYTID